jgi:hypothetical protein
MFSLFHKQGPVLPPQASGEPAPKPAEISADASIASMESGQQRGRALPQAATPLRQECGASDAGQVCRCRRRRAARSRGLLRRSTGHCRRQSLGWCPATSGVRRDRGRRAIRCRSMSASGESTGSAPPAVVPAEPLPAPLWANHGSIVGARWTTRRGTRDGD